MQTTVNLRRSACAVALLTVAAGGSGLFAGPAGAATTHAVTLVGGTVTVTGTAVRDEIAIREDATALTVDFGFDGVVDARFARASLARVNVFAGGGDDGITVEGAGVGDVPITVNGGDGADGIGVVGNIGDAGAGDALVTINGNRGNDDIIAATPGPITVRAGAGADSVDGGGAGVGHETVALGTGDDRFVSSLNTFVGVRSDVVDGGAGKDSLEVDGTFASETVSLSAGAGHLVVRHNLLDRIDADNVEFVTWRGFGGSDEGNGGDAVTVNDLTGTDVVSFMPDFTDPLDNSGPNTSADTLTVRGTAGDDQVAVSNLGADLTVSGLAPATTATSLDAQDTLVIDTLAGRDTVDTSGLEPGAVQLHVR